jgi:hypothetical protein
MARPSANSDLLNFVDRDADFELLLQCVRGWQGLRDHFGSG